MVELDPAVRAYYEQGTEAGRLLGGTLKGALELERTKELILRDLPPGTLDVLDVGGGAGVYASWLADQGHRVSLIEPIPVHVQQAREADGRITAELGDARDLSSDDRSVDLVLLLGPLYHLLDGDERVAALSEAHCVLRPGDTLIAAGIARFSFLLDLLVVRDEIHEAGLLEAVSRTVATGEFLGDEYEMFTNAYLHLPEELSQETQTAGFTSPQIFSIESFGCLVPDFADRWEDPKRRKALLEAVRLIEAEPSIQAAAGHLLAVAEKASQE